MPQGNITYARDREYATALAERNRLPSSYVDSNLAMPYSMQPGPREQPFGGGDRARIVEGISPARLAINLGPR